MEHVKQEGIKQVLEKQKEEHQQQRSKEMEEEMEYFRWAWAVGARQGRCRQDGACLPASMGTAPGTGDALRPLLIGP